MLKRFFTPPATSSYFLFGPRGTGKTTWLKHHYPEAYWIDLNAPDTFRFFSAAPEKLSSTLAAIAEHKIVIID